jgi:hypothetical protein
MSPSRIFILRPVATSLLMVAILLSGIVAYRMLPVSALPQVDYPTIQVLTFYPGASPDVIASSVTAPLERQFGQMPGLNQMTSSSSFGSSLITLQFTLDLNLDIAEQEVQAAINSAGTFLPRDLPNARLQQDKPGRCAGAHARPHVGHVAVSQGPGPGGHQTRAKDLAVARGRAGGHKRGKETRGENPGESDCAGGLQPES